MVEEQETRGSENPMGKVQELKEQERLEKKNKEWSGQKKLKHKEHIR